MKKEFDEKAAKKAALEVCMNNPSLGFDWASIVNGRRDQFNQDQAYIAELEAQFKMKQGDWLEACKEIDVLEAKLATAIEYFDWMIAQDWSRHHNVDGICNEALMKLNSGKPVKEEGSDSAIQGEVAALQAELASLRNPGDFSAASAERRADIVAALKALGALNK